MVTNLETTSVMQRLLAAAGWDAGSVRHKQLQNALDGAGLEIVDVATTPPDLRGLLLEAKLQIDYLHKKFQPTGTGEATLARIEVALSSGGAAQRPMDPATIEACAKIAESNGWEATAAQIRALETGERLL